jgi:TolB-like protein
LRTLRFALPGLIALALTPPVLKAQDKPTVAVFDIRATALGRPEVKELATTFTDMLTTELAKNPTIRIITRDELNAALTKANYMLSGRVSDEEAQRVGRIIGAQYFILGGVFFERGNARMDIRLVETETTKTHAALKEVYKEDQLLSLVEAIAKSLARDVKVPTVVRAEDVKYPTAAVLTYSRGLDFEKRGKKAQAAQMFNKTLQLSPNHAEARKALDRVKSNGGKS